jgi:hypothetical protein
LYPQGVLLLAMLLVVLWLPLLVFSSGAPTYQTPTVVDVSLNVTVAQVRGQNKTYPKVADN